MTEESMTKSELIERIVAAQVQQSGSQLSSKDVELAVKTMIEQMSLTLASGERIEIRGFGSFSLHYRAPRIGRNPKTGESVGLAGKHVPHFKPGKELRDRVNTALHLELEQRKSGDGVIDGQASISFNASNDPTL
jgi:integration host factor subunit beta